MKNVMLAATILPDLDKDVKYPVLVSAKLDGVRACVQEGKCVAGRSLKDSLNRHITAMLSRPEFEGLDGELTDADEVKQHDFNHNQSIVMTQSGTPKFTFHVFDDLTNSGMTAIDRKARELMDRVLNLKAMGHPVEYCTQHFCHNAEEVRELYEHYTGLGYEGLILASPDARYKHGRSTLKQGILLKMKPCEDSEATIIGFEELMHNEDAGNSKCQANLFGGDMLGALIVQWQDKTFKIGTGFDHETRRRIWHNQQDYLGKLVTFKFMHLSKYGVPRGPVFKGIRSKDDLS